jgi:hypothetical protein
MERFGTYDEEGFHFEAFVTRRRDTLYEYVIKVSRDGEPVAEERVEMTRYEDWDEHGNITERIVGDPYDLSNVAKLEQHSSRLLEDLKKTYAAD